MHQKYKKKHLNMLEQDGDGGTFDKLESFAIVSLMVSRLFGTPGISVPSYWRVVLFSHVWSLGEFQTQNFWHVNRTFMEELTNSLNMCVTWSRFHATFP